MPLSCPKNTPTSLFCLNCPQSHWILCFPSSQSLSNGRHSLYGACPYSGRRCWKQLRCVVDQLSENMLQMLKLNDLLFRLFSKPRRRELVEIPISLYQFIPLVETVRPSALARISPNKQANWMRTYQLGFGIATSVQSPIYKSVNLFIHSFTLPLTKH